MSEQGSPGVDGDQPTRARVLALVDFLKAYDAVRNPPVRAVPAYGLFDLRQQDLQNLPGVMLRPVGQSEDGAEVWLAVDFAEYPPAPEPPADLAGLLAGRIVAGQPVIRPTLPAEQDLAGQAEAASSQAERDRLLGELALLAPARAWCGQVWVPYVEHWQQARTVKDLYRRLFEAGQMVTDNRETYELVWGFVGLRWAHADGVVDHPLLVVPVEIVRDPETLRLTVTATGAATLDTLPVSGLDLRDPSGLSAKRTVLDEMPVEVWDRAVLAEQARSAVRLMHADGVVDGEGGTVPGAPVADTSWRLFLRRRRPDYQGFLDRMRELYASDAVPPDALATLVVDAPSALAADETAEQAGGLGASEPLLLPLPSNEEQQRILTLAQTQTGVVVQGPPGTGKSHTIANLVSHYVAYGHRVLVVAEKEQALRVLKDKIPEQIRDLTVSVLGADAAERDELGKAIGQIQALVGLDVGAEDKRIADLTGQLARTDASIAEATDRLMAAARREGQMLPGRWPCGDEPTPSTAAAWLHVTAGRDYIPDALTPDTPAPLTPAELAELATLMREIGLATARRCANTLPDLARVPTEGALRALLAEQRDLAAALAPHEPAVSWPIYDATSADALAALGEHVADVLAQAERAESPWMLAVAGKLTDPLLRGEWEQVHASLTQARAAAVGLRQALAAHELQVPDPDPELAAGLGDARERLTSRGKLGLFAGAAKAALERCSVDGHTPRTGEEVELCQRALELAEVRRRMARTWNTQVELVQAPPLSGPRPEEDAGALLASLEFALTRSRIWDGLRQHAHAAGVALPGRGERADLEHAQMMLQALTARPRLLQLRAEAAALRDYLDTGRGEPGAGPQWLALRDALDGDDLAGWAAARQDTADLAELAPRASRLVSLTQRLAAAAPLWADEITADPAAAGVPVDLPGAWAWRQLQTWVAGVIAAESPEALQEHLDELGRRRRRLVADLVGARARRRLYDNLGDAQRAAMSRYVSAVRRYGKTGGKFAARWLKEIREALNDSKDAVPVWIMPTSRALNSFRPDPTPPFDVLIVDEASQIDLQALPLFALARKAIVVGDREQVSPGAVGQDQQRVFDLIDTHLRGVPNAKTLFNVGNSLYDVALDKFPRLVMLREHFRCLPEIIAFSNELSYGGKIEPLRDQRPSPDWPALGSVKVLDGYRRGAGVNEPEAHAVVDLIAELHEDPRYARMTFGVVTLLSGGQDELIRTLLFERLGPQAIADRALRIGDAPTFQGDERDVVVVSLVAATDPGRPSGRIGPFTKDADRRRVNVAASRARNQMWVVHSLEPERFPNGDFRAELIRHCREPFDGGGELGEQLDRCDSPFEREVFRRLVARGYRRVRAQVVVGTPTTQFRLDLVAEGPQSRLAIECDGEQWHGEDRWHADHTRQQILERAGWTFQRIRGSAFYRDPDAAMEPVWAHLDKLGIPTGDEWLREAAEATVTRREVRGLPRIREDDDHLATPTRDDDEEEVA